MTNAALIARLVKAKEGTRALSDEVLLALGWTKSKPDPWKIGELAWKKPNGQWAGMPPHPTSSLDDTVDLVPEGWDWDLTSRNIAIICSDWNDDEAKVFWSQEQSRGKIGFSQSIGTVATPAIALSICILKSLETESGTGG